MQNMIGMVRSLRGHVSEAVRAQVAFALCKVIQEGLATHLKGWWSKRARPKFLDDCGIDADPATVPDDIALASTNALAEYFNKWRAVEAYRDDDEWVPLEGPILHLKSTMLEELEAITR